MSRQRPTTQPPEESSPAAQLEALQAAIVRLQQENEAIKAGDRELRSYIREKTNQLLNVMGTLSLKTEELDDDTLIGVDPIGIVAESFSQVLEHLHETNENLSLVNDEIQAIFDSAGVAIMLVDNQRILRAYNKKSQELFFPDRPDQKGQSCSSCICCKTAPPQLCTFNLVMETQKMVENNNFLNDSRYFHTIGTPIKNNQGEITHVILIYTDITERKATEDKLRESEERYRTLYTTMQEGVAQHRLIYDEDGHPCDYEILDINKAGERIYGFTRERIVGRKGSEIYPLIDGNPACLEQFSKACSSGETSGFESEVKYQGRRHILRISVTPLTSEYFATIFEDITQRKLNEEKIEKLAYSDPLTGLPNRALMHDRLGQMIVRAKRNSHRISLFFIDLDHFKKVNDTFGHDKGDQLLIIVADRLKKVLRNCDSVARLGGDEFVILIDDINDREDASLIACKILESMAQPIILDNKEVVTTTSIGIAMFPEDGVDPVTLLKNADTAMYRSKEMGRNTYRFYSEEMNAQGLEKLLLANDLRKALKQQEFHLKYQPQIDLGHGQLIGLDTQLCWQHPELGDIPTEQFISLAEETGLILSIGSWFLKTACQQTRTIQKKCNQSLSIALKLSTRQFQDSNLIPLINEVLRDSGLSAEFLEIELTEGLLMENVENALKTLHELKELGVTITIANFGTGYSSLSQLRNFPIDRIKIDKSFIQRLASHTDDTAITEAMISMAHIIGIKVIADGIEQKFELNFLREKQCDAAQGGYFSKPFSAAELIEKILNQPAFCFYDG